MEEMLIECCEKIITLMNELKEKSIITQEEYEIHIAIKKNFLDELSKTRICFSSFKQ